MKLVGFLTQFQKVDHNVGFQDGEPWMASEFKKF